jgi:ribosomal 50S subunit-recycling heat shock protein
MRLDQFLRASRLVLRRTVAQELCAAGAVIVNGASARPSRAVRAGDEIALHRRERVLTVRVNAVPDTRNVSKSEAAALYEIVKDERPDNDELTS